MWSDLLSTDLDTVCLKLCVFHSTGQAWLDGWFLYLQTVVPCLIVLWC